MVVSFHIRFRFDYHFPACQIDFIRGLLFVRRPWVCTVKRCQTDFFKVR